MDLVAPGRTFSRQGRGKVPRGSGTTCAKRACCIYLLNTNKRWAPGIPRFYYQQNALQKRYFFENPNDEKVCRWVGGPKTTAGSMKSAPPTHPQTIRSPRKTLIDECRKQTMLARVGKKSRAGRENNIFGPNGTHAGVTDLSHFQIQNRSIHCI